MKQILILLVLSIFIIPNFANDYAHVTFAVSEEFGLRVDAKIENNLGGISILYYRKDGTGDVLQVNVGINEPQWSLYRLNPLTDYIFEAYQGDELIAREDVLTGSSCDEILDGRFAEITGDLSIDMVVIDIKIKYIVFAVDKYGYTVWCCNDCGPVNNQYAQDGTWIVQDKTYFSGDMKDPFDDNFVQWTNLGNVAKRSLSGQTEMVINTTEYPFVYEIEPDRLTANKFVTLGEGETPEDEWYQTFHLTQPDFETGEYKSIIDYSKDFDMVQDYSPDEDGWMHVNSAKVSEYERSYITSFKSFSCATSHDYDTGELKWILSGQIHSDFTFDKPSSIFYAQHDIQQLSNGNILLFDNGNWRPAEDGGLYSRAAEYQLDMDKMVATLVWEFNTEDYGKAKGTVRRLANGNTWVYCGQCGDPLGFAWEVDSDSNVVGTMHWPVEGVFTAYRAYPVESLNGEKVLSTQEAFWEAQTIKKKTIKEFIHNDV